MSDDSSDCDYDDDADEQSFDDDDEDVDSDCDLHKSYFRATAFLDEDEEDEDDDYYTDDEEDHLFTHEDATSGSHEEHDFEASPIEIPFWFGNEDSEHVKYVLKAYDNFLGLNSHRSANSRMPIRFIGKVIRQAIEDDYIIVRQDDFDYDQDVTVGCDTSNSKQQRVLVTSETLFIYERSQKLEPGSISKCMNKLVIETMYDYDEGVPIHIFMHGEEEEMDEVTSLEHISILQCRPFGANEHDFHYSSQKVTQTPQLLEEISSSTRGLTYSDLYSQCLQNAEPILNKLKPKLVNTISDGEATSPEHHSSPQSSSPRGGQKVGDKMSSSHLSHGMLMINNHMLLFHYEH
ncbi:hypothetical protein C9374_012831 [Naegleria lovaniensis]|uniref:Uncharacterized protein n=1 Tax=Naegleria lovaniensis TaxID=51637 RepID=A0AA88KDN8_NAELO|nr:uncharacterized protein C9374_012831 [Naegleria lovaniensis]KAG2373099.1 hypothetical protein C9374_012831 [Naegleria lovaniensis]